MQCVHDVEVCNDVSSHLLLCVCYVSLCLLCCLLGVYEYTEPAEDGSQQLVINAQNW